MDRNDQRLSEIWDKTRGKCHLCGSKRAFSNYGQHGARGAWEVDHSNPRAKGGSDNLRNLFAACTSCNRSKQATRTRAMRRANDMDGAPLSARAYAAARTDNVVGGAVIGTSLAMTGVALAEHSGTRLGFGGFLFFLATGAMVGAAIGGAIDPEA